MSKIERIFLFALLTICAVMLALIAFNSLQAASAQQARLDKVQKLAAIITQNMDDITAIQTAYEKNAYNNPKVTTIQQQTFIAIETTNTLLVKLSEEVIILSQLQMP